MLLRGGETTDRPQKRENDSTNPYGALSFCNEIRDGKKGERLVCSTVLHTAHPVRRIPLFHLLRVVYIHFRLLDARQGV